MGFQGNQCTSTELKPQGKENKRHYKNIHQAKLLSPVHFHAGNKSILQTPKLPDVTVRFM